ncbi:PRKAA1 (predicted) [Pycnogonum litorale]
MMDRQRIADSNFIGLVLSEIRILKLLHHPHIMQLYRAMTTPNYIIMLTEYASGGDLICYMDNHGKLEEPEARRLFQQLMSAVDYCHRHMVVHRDLKLDNLLLDKDLNLKIADFGFSHKVIDGELLNYVCGTSFYMAPEIISNELYDGYMVDIWSSGIILYAVLCGELPFYDEDQEMLCKKIHGGIFQVPSDLGESVFVLLAHIIKVDPIERATMTDIRKHDWFKKDLPPCLFPLPIEESQVIAGY